MDNKVLIYDDSCPLCAWYSSLFVKTGLLPANGRKAFSSLDSSLLNLIDYNRGRNEIPLIDKTSGQVFYGIDTLLEILGQRYRFIKSVGKIKPIHWLLKKSYKLVSYNRKVIVAKKCGAGNIDCSPDISYLYRFMFLFFSLVFNTILLFPLNNEIFSPLAGPGISVNHLQAAHFALVAGNCLLALKLSQVKAMEYLGQVSMLALLTILLLIPLMTIQYWFVLPRWFTILYMAATAIVVFKEYLRRMEYAGILNNNRWIAAANLTGMFGFVLFLFL
jgi:hypothetical protein